MGKLVVAIDCDDVLIHTTEHTIAQYNQLYGTQVQLTRAYLSNNDEWQASREEVLQRIADIQHTDEYAAIAPLQVAVDAVQRLAESCELHMVTARSAEVMKVTERMVHQYFPGCFASINHIGSDKSKGEICAMLGASVLIDDNHHHLLAARDHGVEWRVWFGDYPWQQEGDPGAYTIRVFDWPALEAEIARYVRP